MSMNFFNGKMSRSKKIRFACVFISLFVFPAKILSDPQGDF